MSGEPLISVSSWEMAREAAWPGAATCPMTTSRLTPSTRPEYLSCCFTHTMIIPSKTSINSHAHRKASQAVQHGFPPGSDQLGDLVLLLYRQVQKLPNRLSIQHLVRALAPPRFNVLRVPEPQRVQSGHLDHGGNQPVLQAPQTLEGGLIQWEQHPERGVVGAQADPNPVRHRHRGGVAARLCGHAGHPAHPAPRVEDCATQQLLSLQAVRVFGVKRVHPNVPVHVHPHDGQGAAINQKLDVVDWRLVIVVREELQDFPAVVPRVQPAKEVDAPHAVTAEDELLHGGQAASEQGGVEESTLLQLRNLWVARRRLGGVLTVPFEEQDFDSNANQEIPVQASDDVDPTSPWRSPEILACHQRRAPFHARLAQLNVRDVLLLDLEQVDVAPAGVILSPRRRCAYRDDG
mmetsp:Transcript_174/g.415  ORF Transcript_174/g.415 Transcript_174/m.415 type:complete len:405 (+) Transcript_174:1583-2797(+)